MEGKSEELAVISIVKEQVTIITKVNNWDEGYMLRDLLLSKYHKRWSELRFAVRYIKGDQDCKD